MNTQSLNSFFALLKCILQKPESYHDVCSLDKQVLYWKTKEKLYTLINNSLLGEFVQIVYLFVSFI